MKVGRPGWDGKGWWHCNQAEVFITIRPEQANRKTHMGNVHSFQDHARPHRESRDLVGGSGDVSLDMTIAYDFLDLLQ